MSEYKFKDEYSFISYWLTQEPNPKLVIPYIKEMIQEKKINDIQIASLRTKCNYIMEHGHSEFMMTSVSPERVCKLVFNEKTKNRNRK